MEYGKVKMTCIAREDSPAGSDGYQDGVSKVGNCQNAAPSGR